MAGDTYSFVIDNFQEKNLGRYSITAENQFGKATCSAEIIFEEGEFSLAGSAPRSQTIITEEVVTKKVGGEQQEIRSETTKTVKTVSSETKCTETLPYLTRDLSTQASHPQMRDMSSQSSMNTRDTGIQIQSDLRDKGSQIEVIRKRDGSSQWSRPTELEIETFANIGNESAPFVSQSGGAYFNSSNIDANTSSSYSYMQQSVAYNSSSNVDFSTTLIKDVNPHYEPVELIIGRSENNINHSGSVHTNLSSSTYVKEIDSFHHKPLQRFEPINLIIHKPNHRSGSLPPSCSRVNFKSSMARSDFEHTDTEDESCCYVYADRPSFDQSYQSDRKMTCYKEIERRSSRPVFKPVELILDASSLSDSGKRYRDMSLPSARTSGKRIRMPSKHRTSLLTSSSFIYENDLDYDSTSSDFISDRYYDTAAKDSRYAKYSSSFSKSSVHDEREKLVKVVEQKLPAMEMTIDLKAPPSIDEPLQSITVYEGQTAKLECILNGMSSHFKT